MGISVEDLKELIEINAKVEKVSNLSSDGKNLLTRIPKDIRDFLKLKKGDKLRWLVEEDNIKLEVIPNAD
jgi:hypothetical protein